MRGCGRDRDSRRHRIGDCSRFSGRFGAIVGDENRDVPTVHWGDVGGLGHFVDRPCRRRHRREGSVYVEQGRKSARQK
jgi:hypothetical protein